MASASPHCPFEEVLAGGGTNPSSGLQSGSTQGPKLSMLPPTLPRGTVSRAPTGSEHRAQSKARLASSSWCRAHSSVTPSAGPGDTVSCRAGGPASRVLGRQMLSESQTELCRFLGSLTQRRQVSSEGCSYGWEWQGWRSVTPSVLQEVQWKRPRERALSSVGCRLPESLPPFVSRMWLCPQVALRCLSVQLQKIGSHMLMAKPEASETLASTP